MQQASSASEQPPLSIVGERVALGPLHRGMLPLMWRWENDLALAPLTGDPMRPLTLEMIEADYEKYAKTDQSETVRFVIYERATLRPIGGVALGQISYLHRTAELGIAIGEEDCRGKGYGTEAVRLILDYAFTALGLHNVMLRVFAFNTAAIRAYQKAGFREIGRRREAHRYDNRTHDEILMDAIASDFGESTLRPQMP